MTEETHSQEDLEFRRGLMRRAIEDIWQVDLGERQPAHRPTIPEARPDEEHHL